MTPEELSHAADVDVRTATKYLRAPAEAPHTKARGRMERALGGAGRRASRATPVAVPAAGAPDDGALRLALINRNRTANGLMPRATLTSKTIPGRPSPEVVAEWEERAQRLAAAAGVDLARLDRRAPVGAPGPYQPIRPIEPTAPGASSAPAPPPAPPSSEARRLPEIRQWAAEHLVGWAASMREGVCSLLAPDGGRCEGRTWEEAAQAAEAVLQTAGTSAPEQEDPAAEEAAPDQEIASRPARLGEPEPTPGPEEAREPTKAPKPAARDAPATLPSSRAPRDAFARLQAGAETIARVLGHTLGGWYVREGFAAANACTRCQASVHLALLPADGGPNLTGRGITDLCAG